MILTAAETFKDAASVLSVWLDKGAVNGRNSNRFYTMLHRYEISNPHI